MKQHPIAKLLTPPLSKGELEAYENDVIKNGQIDDIIIHEGMILDKWHMFKILEKLKIKPRFKDFHKNGVSSPENFVIAKLQGRNLTVSRKACIAAEYWNMNRLSHSDRVKEAWNTRRMGLQLKDSLSKTSDVFSIGRTSLMKACCILKEDEALFNQCKFGNLSINNAYCQLRANKPSKYRDIYVEKHQEAIKETEQVTIPQVFDSLEVIENFTKQMASLGWIFEHKINKDGLHFGNFYGNGFTPCWDRIEQTGASNKYKEAVVRAAFEKLKKKK